MPRRALVQALFFLALFAASAHAGPAFVRIARQGDAFPGRPGHVYTDARTPFIGARSNDPSGDIFFTAAAKAPDGSTLDDLLVYRRATSTVEPFVQNGETIDGAPFTQTWGAVGGGPANTISHFGLLQDGSPGGAAAVVVSGPGAARFVAAKKGMQAPGQPQLTTFTDVGTASGAFLDVNMNRTGVVSYGGRFRDQGNTLRYGYYLTRPGSAPERIIDSTMPVPGRPTGQWVNSDAIAAPFDIYTPGLDEAGNAYFRAKYNDAGKNYRAFYKRAADGSISPIADAGAADPVPGLPAGHAYNRFSTAANNQRGDVAFGATINKPDGTPFGSGVFAARAGQGLSKILAHGDAVPGIPEAQDHNPGLISMNNTGHLLLTDNYFLNGLGGQSLVLYNPDGSAEPVLRFDQTPGFPGERAGVTTAADLNSLGDALFVTRMNTSAQNYACFAYLNDVDKLVPILKTGDALDGLTVVNFGLGGGANDPLGSIGASSGPVCWDHDRNLSLSVQLRDAAGQSSYALYVVHVPEPAGAATALLAVAVLRTRTRSRG